MPLERLTTEEAIEEFRKVGAAAGKCEDLARELNEGTDVNMGLVKSIDRAKKALANFQRVFVRQKLQDSARKKTSAWKSRRGGTRKCNSKASSVIVKRRPKKVLSAEEQAAKDAKAVAAAEKKAAAESKKKEKMDAMKAEIYSLITNFELGAGKSAAIKLLVTDAKTIGQVKSSSCSPHKYKIAPL